MIDEAEKEQSEAGATSDWEMDRESFGSEQGTKLDLMEEELMHLILKTSPSNPSVLNDEQQQARMIYSHQKCV